MHQALGSRASAQDKLSQAQDHFLRGLALCQELGSRSGIAHCQLFLANTLEAHEKFDEAIQIYADASTTIDELGDKAYYKAWLTDGMGTLDYSLGNFDAAINKLSIALDMYRSNHRSATIRTLNNRGRSWLALNAFEKAEADYLEALNLALLTNDPIYGVFIIESVLGLANLKGKTGSLIYAVSLLALVSIMTKDFEVIRFANRFLEELRPLLMPEKFDAAFEWGKALGLDKVVTDLLANPIFPVNAHIGGASE